MSGVSNLWVSDWPPLDSKASIDAAFEYLVQATTWRTI